MTLKAQPRFVVKNGADGTPYVFLEDMDETGLLISLQLRPGATMDTAWGVADILTRSVSLITIQSRDYITHPGSDTP